MYRKLFDIYPAYTLLKINLTGDLESQSRYINHVNEHNNRILNNPYHIDAGFDLISPNEQIMCGKDAVSKVNFQIKCMATIETVNGSYNTGYYLYPRSSIMKTPLRLANSVGIIDAGYRGNIIGAFDCQTSEYDIAPFTRLAQICAPSLMPIVVEIVNELTETERGEGGFGSSGK